jgi:hypothetical protein
MNSQEKVLPYPSGRMLLPGSSRMPMQKLVYSQRYRRNHLVSPGYPLNGSPLISQATSRTVRPLEGKGKWARNVKISSLKDVNREVLQYYIRQAVKLDSS